VSAAAGAGVFFGGPAIGISEAWCVVPVLVGFLVVMEVLIPGTAWRQVGTVTLATIAFGLTVDSLGLAVAMAVSLTLCAAGTPETRWLEYFLFLGIMLAVGIGTFVWLLGMPIPIWPVRAPDWLPFLQR
jgi:putative tricarboxylic transport membrane protein